MWTNLMRFFLLKKNFSFKFSTNAPSFGKWTKCSDENMSKTHKFGANSHSIVDNHCVSRCSYTKLFLIDFCFGATFRRICSNIIFSLNRYLKWNIEIIIKIDWNIDEKNAIQKIVLAICTYQWSFTLLLYWEWRVSNRCSI